MKRYRKYFEKCPFFGKRTFDKIKVFFSIMKQFSLTMYKINKHLLKSIPIFISLTLTSWLPDHFEGLARDIV